MSDFNQKEYVKAYRADNIKRVPLDMQIAEYETVKAAAVVAGESVNGYIKEAIRRRMKSEGGVKSD